MQRTAAVVHIATTSPGRGGTVVRGGSGTGPARPRPGRSVIPMSVAGRGGMRGVSVGRAVRTPRPAMPIMHGAPDSCGDGGGVGASRSTPCLLSAPTTPR
ncbi:hypothetical protein E2C01_043008 [Portunus trituberculatus]|uniref:Uncharacterized protein n=1 Tax=Portunus trituberculatus TaxID=210409 RepID=A0A5B7FRS1_PORTR|nr:hypothetical protein [Portunus trituberculatus]